MEIFNVGTDAVNIYLIDSGSHRLLVDSGFPGKINGIGRTLRKTGFRIQDIDYLMVTHFHIDHAGAVQELKVKGITFCLFEPQIPFIAPMEQMASGKWPYETLTMADNHVLAISDSRAFLQSIGLEGQVLSTPGHTDDSVTLLLDSGEAFTGDLRATFLVDDPMSPEAQSWTLLKNKKTRDWFIPGMVKFMNCEVNQRLSPVNLQSDYKLPQSGYKEFQPFIEFCALFIKTQFHYDTIRK